MSSILVEDTPDIDQLNKEAWSINRSDAIRAIELSEEALKKSAEIKYKKGMAHAYKTLGAAHIWISKYEDALRHSFEAVQLFKELHDKKNEAETYYNIGVNFRYLADYDSAIKYQNQSYNLYNELKDEVGMADALNGLGTVYYSIEQNEKALEVLLESQKLCLKHNCLDIYVKVLEGIGETYYNLKNYKGALDYCTKSVTICNQIGSKQVEAFALDGLGRTHTALKNYKDALKNYQQSLSIREEMGFKAGVAITLNNIGSLYIEKGDIDEGVKCLEESYKLSQKINSKEGIYRASEKLAEVYETTGQLDKAIEFFKIFQSTREEVRNEKTNQLVKSVELQHKVLHSQAEKALLEEKAKELASYSNNLILLGEIGQQIISHLNIANIVETVYGHVNHLMDATGFGIGLHIPESNKVVFPLFIEDDERFENISYDLGEKDKLTVICFNERKEIIINDFPNQIMQYVGYHQAPLQGKVVESILYFPLVAKDKVMGVITVQSFKKHAYSAYHVNMLRNLAAFAAIALENAKMYEEEEKKVAQRTLEVIKQKEEVEKAYQNNKLLSEIGQQITSSLSIEDIAVKLHSYCNQLMDATCFSIRLYNPEKNHIEYKYGYERGERKENVIISMDDVNNFSVWCIANRKEIFINDILTEYKKYTKEIKVVFGDMPYSLIFYPLLRGDKVLGCFTVQSFEKNAYKDYHLDIIKTLASYTAIALDNANLYEHMEENVKARTMEVVKQKEELERANESTRLLSQIGNDITSTLSIEEIIEKAYTNVNSLMDAAVLGIGVYNETSNQLIFPGSIEKGKKLPPHPLPIAGSERPAVKCFLSQKEYLINNFTEEKLKSGIIVQKPVAGENTESIIYVPVTHKEKRIGVITVQSFKENAYSDHHLQILKTLAVYVAIAIDNASLYTNMEERVKERTGEIEKAYENNRLLSEIGQQITSTLNFENIFEKLHGYVNQLMNADCFGVRIYHPETNTIEYKFEIERGVRDYEVIILPLDPEGNFSSWCVKHKKEILINDHDKEYNKYINDITILAGDMTHSLLFLPIMVGERVLGVITVQSFERNAYTNYHLDILKSLASYTAIALENASLYEHMEEKVNERTQELVKQKEEVEKTYENTRLLSQIGKDITATLSIEDIIGKVYTNVNNLMDATTFGIGVFNEAAGEIVFPATVEKGEKLPPYSYRIDQLERPAVWCYTTQQDYVINHYAGELIKSNKYKDFAPEHGELPEAIIYVPVTQNDKKIGVITVQSFTPNAYNDYHLQILKNLAVYAAIAIDNASLYTGMEKRVKDRTEEIEKNYRDTLLLSQIAEDISASLSVETIISKVYQNVNKLLKADCFGIGILNESNAHLEFKGFVENDELMPDFSYASNDPNRLASICFTSKKEIFINDYSVDYKKYIKGIQAPVSGKDSASIIYLPLYSKGKTIGVFTVQSFVKNVYTSYHLNILKNLAVSIGIALDNANLYQNLEEKVNERTREVVKQKEEIEKTYENTRLLNQIGKDITATLSIEEIIDKVYSNVNNLMDATGFGIGVHQKDSNELYFPLYIEGKEKFRDTYFSLDSKDRLAVICFNTGQELILNNFAVDVKKYVENPPKVSAGSDHVESVIYMPLFLKEKVLGVITVQSFVPNAYTEYHLNILRNLAVYASIAIDNSSLYENMEERVVERTAEVTKQKEQLEKNFADNRLITQVTKDITSSLSVETIISKVYENVNTLMKAESFGIGIYNPATESLQFPGFIERSEKMPFFEFYLKDKNRFAVWCFDNEKEIIINDLFIEYNKYIKDLVAPIAGESPESILYLPLYTKDKKIGVITVQSFDKNAYSEYQVNILRNIALSVAIALDNANLYQNLEEKVKERTLEVVKQKEEIEKTYENTRLLSKIGTDITSTLSIATIIAKVYDNVNTLMDATGFGIGVYDEKTGNIVYPLYIEGEERWKNVIYKKEDEERLTNICFHKKAEIIINDFDTEIKQYVKGYQAPLKGKNVASLIYLPLILKDKPLGVITVQSFVPKSYTDYHLQILKSLGVYVAIAIDNASLYRNLEDRVVERTAEVTKQKEQLEKNFQDTKLIAQITKDITSSLSVETIVSKVYENVNTLMRAESFGIGLYNPKTKSIQFNGYIEHSKKLDFFEFPLSDENRFAVWCFGNEKEIIINDVQLEYNKYVKVRKAPVAGQSPESILYMPLYTKEKKIGVITVQSFTKHTYSDYQVNILRNIAISVAIAIDNANLYENLEEKVKERSAEVMEQKRIIEATNKDITDSIKYAKKIQLALIPDAENLKRSFNESFIYYRPKDIVSGDFYWIEQFPSATVFAAADCTGHGVPGAFMSLICNDLMSQVIKDPSVTTPAQALTILDDKLRAMLNKSSDHSSNDGMDIALCAYYPKKMLLQFAGAHRPLLLMRNGDLIEYKPSKHSIGGYLSGKKVFDDNNIQLQKGDQIYILTDGYADQFGGEKGKKFKFKRLEKLISSISHLPMSEQLDLIDGAFTSWRGKHEQVDDVCVIGVKV